MKKNYKNTLISCYLAFITQAICANFAPLLYLLFHNTYNIPLGKIALISSVFFFAQLIVDVICAKFVDKIGYRKCIVTSQVMCALGFIGLSFLPEIMPSPFLGIILSVIVYAVGSGLIEVLASPIVEACPFDNKDSVMSLLHSFYCWGSVGVIGISTFLFHIFGIGSWKWVACLWAIVPLINIFNFATCPIELLVEDGKGLSGRELFSLPTFWISIVLMICAGASELSMSQWASAYAESALMLPKTLGDLVGPALFAVSMGISRVIYGKMGDKIDLSKYMIGSGILCLICYIMASMTANPIIGLIGCIMCGFSVAIMWPGTISISSAGIPLGGTAMFAYLAMAGDLGGAFGPGMVGFITQTFGDNIKIGMMFGCIFPIVLIISIIKLKSLARQH